MLSYKDIIGHDEIKEHLKKAVSAHRVSHAYILTGEAGMGRKSLAKAYAMTLLCEKGLPEPCMECHACKQVMAGSHPDLIMVSHEKPASIGVDDIREQVSETVDVRPYSSYYKVYIIDEAEKMTQQAQNALLKTIEEPPSYAVIILLTTNEEMLLETIRSRCVKLTLKPLNDSVVAGYLIDTMHVTEDDAKLYAAFARGNLGKAISMAGSDEFKETHDAYLNILKSIKSADMGTLLDDIKYIKESGDSITEFLMYARLWYRDVLMYKVTKDMNMLVFKKEYNKINEMSKHSEYAAFERILESIEKTEDRLEANVNPDLALELMLLTMKEN